MTDAQEDKVQDFRDQVFEETRKGTRAAIDARIEEEENKIIEGDGSFWGFIKGFLFNLAKMFNLEGFAASIAHWFDPSSPLIPSNEEKDAIANHVADAVSETVSKNKFKDSAHMQAEVSKAVREKLMDPENRKSFKSLDDQQIQDAANQAGAKAAENFGKIDIGYKRAHRKDDSQNKPALEFTNNVQENIKKSVTKMIEDNVGESLSTTQKEQLVSIGTKVIIENKELIDSGTTKDIDALADKYIAGLESTDLPKLMEKQGFTKNDLKKVIIEALNENKDTLKRAASGAASVPDAKITSTPEKKSPNKLIEMQLSKNPQIAVLADKQSLDSKDTQELAKIISDIQSLAKDEKFTSYQEVLDFVNNGLNSDDKALNANGRNFSPEARAVLADQLAPQLAAAKGIDASTDAVAKSKAQERMEKLVKSRISAEVNQEIVDATAAKTIKSYNERTGASLYPSMLGGFPTAVHLGDATNGVYSKNDKGEYVQKRPDGDLTPEQLKQKNELVKFAVSQKRGLSDKQREVVSDLVAETISETMAKHKGDGLFTDPARKKELAETLEKEIQYKLSNNREAIDGADGKDRNGKNKATPLATIDKNNGFSMAEMIADSFADKVQNDQKTYDKLQSAHKALHGDQSQMVEKSKDEKSKESKTETSMVPQDKSMQTAVAQARSGYKPKPDPNAVAEYIAPKPTAVVASPSSGIRVG